MKNLVITISDDLDIFESAEAAESYCEPWILESEHNFRAFDQAGNILRGSVVRKKGKWLFGLLPSSYESLKLENSGETNAELLKTEITNYLARVLTKPSEEDLKKLSQLSLSELIEILIKERGLTR